MEPILGGLEHAKLPNKEIHDICDQLKMEVEKKSHDKFDKFVAVCFKTQVVAGTNFFIKVDVGNDWCVHLSVFKPLPCDGGKPSLSDVHGCKRLDEEIAKPSKKRFGFNVTYFRSLMISKRKIGIHHYITKEMLSGEIFNKCNRSQLKMEVEKNIKKEVDEFVAVSFKTQVVAGINFFIKVNVGNDGYLHLRVFKPLSYTGGNPSLYGVQEGKCLDEEILYF